MFTTQPTTSPVPFGFWPNHVNNFHQAGVDHQEWAAMYTITKTENHSCSAIKITRSHNICRWKRTTNSSLKALNMTKQWYPTGSEHPEEKQSKGPDVCVFVCRQQKAEIPSQSVLGTEHCVPALNHSHHDSYQSIPFTIHHTPSFLSCKSFCYPLPPT